jgi:hypothetical protein
MFLICRAARLGGLHRLTCNRRLQVHPAAPNSAAWALLAFIRPATDRHRRDVPRSSHNAVRL